MRMNKKAHLAIAAVFLVLSFLIVLQLKSVTKNTELENAQVQRTEDLQKELTKEKEKNIDLSNQLLQANNNLETYRENAERSDGSSKAFCAG